MELQLQEPSHVDEPKEAQEYADVLSRVAADHQAVIVRRAGADVAAIVPLDYLEMVLDTLAREEAMRIARRIDWDRVVKENPPPQAYFDGDEPKPF